MVAKELVLKAEKRKGLGSKDSAKLRDAGKIPAVVYGHKQQPESVAVDAHEFTEALHHGHRVFDIDIEGKKEKLLLKDIQHDYLGKRIIHADFMRVNLSEKVKVEVSVVIKGTPAGAAEGGILEEHLSMLEVECLVTAIPEAVEVSVKELGVDQSIHAGDVQLPDGVKLLTATDALLVACHIPAAVAEPEPAEEGIEPTSPEVITEKKTEEQPEE